MADGHPGRSPIRRFMAARLMTPGCARRLGSGGIQRRRLVAGGGHQRSRRSVARQSYAAPPIIATQTLQPIQTNVLSSSTIVYDLGQNAAMIPHLTTHGPAGVGDPNHPGGTDQRRRHGQPQLGGRRDGLLAIHPGRHRFGNLDAEIFLSRLPLSAGGTDPRPGFVAIAGGGRLVGRGDPERLHQCGQLLLFHTIYSTASAPSSSWAQRNNLISILTDCPHRERLGWLEQYNLNGPSLRYEFDLGRLFAKTMQDMADSQTSPAPAWCPDIAPEVTRVQRRFPGFARMGQFGHPRALAAISVHRR